MGIVPYRITLSVCVLLLFVSFIICSCVRVVLKLLCFRALLYRGDVPSNVCLSQDNLFMRVLMERGSCRIMAGGFRERSKSYKPSLHTVSRLLFAWLPKRVQVQCLD